jgi:hypothetical protein
MPHAKAHSSELSMKRRKTARTLAITAEGMSVTAYSADFACIVPALSWVATFR